MTSPDSCKQALRQHMKAQRKLVDQDLLALSSGIICENLHKLDAIPMARCVMGYLALSGEVDLDPFLEWAIQRGKRVAVPVTDLVHGRILPVELESLTHGLGIGPMGIREPSAQNRRCLPSDSLDVVVVPGLAFDLSGGRLGYGGGFYDRFLVHLRPSAIVVGVAHDYQILERVPVYSHDVRIGIIITPQGIHRCEA